MLKQKTRGTPIHTILTRMRSWSPVTLQILSGGLLVTIMLLIGALVVGAAAGPQTFDTRIVYREAAAMACLSPVTFGITLAGGFAVEYVSRKKTK